jgi:hypothetical protein
MRYKSARKLRLSDAVGNESLSACRVLRRQRCHRTAEIERLERGKFAPNESANLPCTEVQFEELRKLGRLESDEQRKRQSDDT